MNLLADRFPQLTLFPRLSLVRRTPVERLPLPLDAELWIKRDDLAHDAYGGNKVRKLDYLLGEARASGAEVVITQGAWGSNHVCATSIHGKEWGFEVHAVVSPQPWTTHVERNLVADLAVGTKLHPAHNFALVPAMTKALGATLRLEGRRVYEIPHGGSNPVGTFGYVEAGLELADQIDSGELARPDAIYVPLGSGGTVVGLALGLAAAGHDVPILAMRVTPRAVVNQVVIQRLLRATLERIRAHSPSFPAVQRSALKLINIDTSVYGRGYGRSDTMTRDAIAQGEELGLTLDPTYSGKAFGAMLRDAAGPAAGKRLLYWATLNSASLEPLVANAPRLPGWAKAA